jgi:hypothetical protein
MASVAGIDPAVGALVSGQQKSAVRITDPTARTADDAEGLEGFDEGVVGVRFAVDAAADEVYLAVFGGETGDEAIDVAYQFHEHGPTGAPSGLGVTPSRSVTLLPPPGNDEV